MVIEDQLTPPFVVLNSLSRPMLLSYAEANPVKLSIIFISVNVTLFAES